MKTTIIAVAVSLLSAIAPMTADADIINLEATIDGAQANAGAGTGSPGTGFATMTFDDTTDLFSWNITWQDLLDDVVNAHFHGPALPSENAGVQVSIFIVDPTSPSIGTAIISSAQATDLLAGLWYINIHTIAFGGGEIRGQVRVSSVPEPTTLALLGIGLFGLGLARRRKKV